MVLASTSPRRRDLIGALDIEVLFADPGVAEEEPRRGETVRRPTFSVSRWRRPSARQSRTRRR